MRILNNYETRINQWFDESIQVILKSKILINDIIKVANIISDCFENGHKIIVMGNGGSAADSQHLVAEFIGRFEIERKISAIEAYRLFREHRLRKRADGQLTGNIIVTAEGRQNKVDDHKSFERRIEN